MFTNDFWGGNTTGSGPGSGGGGLTLEEVQGIIDARVTKTYVTNLGIPGDPSPIHPYSADPTQAAKANWSNWSEDWNYDTTKVDLMLIQNSMNGGWLFNLLNINQEDNVIRMNELESRMNTKIYETQDSIHGAETRLNTKITDTKVAIQIAVVPSTNNLGSAANADVAVEAFNAANADTATNALALGGIDASEYVTKDFLRIYIPEIP